MKAISNAVRCAIFAAMLVSLLRAEKAPASVWQIGTIDTDGAGRFSSLKIDKNGNAHVAYIAEGDDNTLKYGFWDHELKRWFTMSLRKGAMFCSLALDSKQRPHISYSDVGAAKGTKVRYVYWDGSAWKERPILVRSDVIGYYTSIVLDPNDYPTITYYEYEGPGGGAALRLHAVSWNGMYWEGRTIDATRGSGKFNFLISGPQGRLQVAYADVDAMNASLRYGYWNGQSWVTEILEGIQTPFYAQAVAAAVDTTGAPHIVYTDTLHKLVKYATRRGDKWELQVVDTILKEAYPDRNGIALDAEGRPYVSYYDAGAGRLKLAYREGSKWISETVDENNAGFCSSLQIFDGTIWVTYADEGFGTLKFARQPLPGADSPARNGAPAPSRTPH